MHGDIAVGNLLVRDGILSVVVSPICSDILASQYHSALGAICIALARDGVEPGEHGYNPAALCPPCAIKPRPEKSWSVDLLDNQAQVRVLASQMGQGVEVA